MFSSLLSHNQDTVHIEMRFAEMLDFRMAALMFLTGNGMKGRTHAHAEIAHLPTWCIIRTWEACGLWARATQALVMHLVEKCALSAWAWVFAILRHCMYSSKERCVLLTIH